MQRLSRFRPLLQLTPTRSHFWKTSQRFLSSIDYMKLNSTPPPPPSSNNNPFQNIPFPKDKKSKYLLLSFLTLSLMLLYSQSNQTNLGDEISFQAFLTDYLAQGKVSQVDIINKRIAHIQLHDPNETPKFFLIGPNMEYVESKIEMVQHSLGLSLSDFIKIRYLEKTEFFDEILKPLLPTLLFIFLLVMISRGVGGVGGGVGGGAGDMFKMGRAKFDFQSKESNKIKFADVAGLSEAKQELFEYIDFLKSPQKYKDIGAKLPKGLLLVGPPGTGKTLLAKAVAGESDRDFFSISGSSFLEMFVGVGASRVRDLFAEAKKRQPCIIFIDEIDAIGKKRNSGKMSNSNDERESTLNQLLIELDGFSTTENSIIVLAATNREDSLDEALIRAGRFDRKVRLEKPDLLEREEIFKTHLQNKKINLSLINPSLLQKRLAALTPGLVGSDIAQICNEACLQAIRHNQHELQDTHFEKAIERTLGGLEKSKNVLSKQQRKIIAYHEAGHCVVSHRLPYADNILKLSIIPRVNGALGFAQYLPDELSLYSKRQMVEKVVTLLGGRASEEIFLGEVSTGASDDLQKATRIVRGLLMVYGMGGGKVSLAEYLGGGDGGVGGPSEERRREIEREMEEMLDKGYVEAKGILEKNRVEVERLVSLLLEKETLGVEEITGILGEKINYEHINPLYKDYYNAQPRIKQPVEVEVKEEKQIPVPAEREAERSVV